MGFYGFPINLYLFLKILMGSNESLWVLMRSYETLWILTIIYNRSLFVATRVKKQTKNKVKDLTSKLGTRMETGRLRRDLLGLRVEQPPGLLFNGLI